MPFPSELPRREFVGGMAATLVAGSAANSMGLGASLVEDELGKPTSGQVVNAVRIGVIGVGSRGTYLLRLLLEQGV